jgi:hypothetical protein
MIIWRGCMQILLGLEHSTLEGVYAHVHLLNIQHTDSWALRYSVIM